MSTPPDAPHDPTPRAPDDRGPKDSDRPGGPKASGKTSVAQLGPAYQGALEAVMAVVVAMGLGVLADSYFESSPVGLFVGLGIGFGSFVLRLTRLLKELTPGTDESQRDETEGPDR